MPTKTLCISSMSFSTNESLLVKLKQFLLISKFGEFELKLNTSKRHLTGHELIEFLQEADVAIVGQEKIGASELLELPKLKHISKYGVGLDNLDLTALHNAGITFGFIPGVNRNSVAELALLFLILCFRKLTPLNSELLTGRFNPHYQGIRGSDLHGKTIGIIGLGNCGKRLVELLQPFECKIISNDIRPYPDFESRYNVTPVSLNGLLLEADAISLHIPRSPHTLNLLDAAALQKVKTGCILVNTARGGLIDESSWLKGMQSGQIGPSASDVYAEEPPKNWDLIRHPLFFGTPHIGGGSLDSVQAMGLAAIQGLAHKEDPRNFIQYQ